MSQISIIIPVIHEAERIQRVIAYLLDNKGPVEVEILVVDGGSSDDTVRLAEAAGAKVLHSAICSRATQMNLGAAHAQAEVLYFVHADTIPPNTYATDIVAALQAGHTMGCYRYRFDSPSRLLRFNAWFVRFPWLWCQGGDKTFFIGRDLFLAYNGYNETYVVMEEYEFLKRILKKHRLLIFPKNALVSARKYEKNSWLRVQIANFIAFSMFRWGEAPEKIKRFYKSFLKQ